MPVLTIDGRKVEASADMTILMAARKAGIEIPVFCFHDGLPVAANCRICLVELTGGRKPVPACEVKVRDGMEVFTHSPMAEQARKSVLEFILLNHPVDCPICDCAGECVLQDHYRKHSARPSRINVRKVHKVKATPIGPNVIFDGERCINCTRCVRFLSEITGSQQLVQTWRGNRTEIALFHDRPLDDPYSLCTVDLCPVGALTSRDFRFRKRAWFLKFADSVCPECSRGCRVRVDHHDGRIWRLQPRVDPRVNKWWACDHGRLAFHRFESNRVLQPHVRLATGSERGDTVEGAATEAAAALSATLAAGRRAAVVVSAFASLEDAMAAFLFAKEALAENTVYLGTRPDGPADKLLVTSDRNPNRRGIAALAEKRGIRLLPVAEMFTGPDALRIGAIVSVGTEYPLPPLPDGVQLNTAVVLAVTEDDVAGHATVLFPIPSHYERAGVYVNIDGMASLTQRAVPRPVAARLPGSILKMIAGRMPRQVSWQLAADLRRKAVETAGIQLEDGIDASADAAQGTGG